MITGKDWASMDGNTVQWDRITDSFVIVRAAYTYNGVPHEDATCKIVRPAAAAHGKVFGAYMILGWHGATPEEQADNFIRIYGQRKPGELPPALDLEADSASALGLTVAQCLAWAERAYARLKKAYGTVMIYTSRRVWGDVFGDLSSVMGEAPLWIKIPYPWQTRRPHHQSRAHRMARTRSRSRGQPIRTSRLISCSTKVMPSVWTATLAPSTAISGSRGSATM